MAEAIATRCPQCGASSPTRLIGDEVCAACRSANAWKQRAGERLVIGRADIEAVEAKLAGEAAGESIAAKIAARAPVLLSLGLAVSAIVSLVILWRPIEIGPLFEVMGRMKAASGWALGLGIAAFLVGLVCAVRLRRQRHFRSLSFLVPHLLALVVGVVAVVLGGLALYASSAGNGWRYDRMPAREAIVLQSEATRRISDATAVIVAPGEDGDARGAALGVGSVIARKPGRAWLVTNSHVAMPAAAVASFRDIADAHDVWVDFADGRGARGQVRWVARPPIDVAIVEVAIADPPEPIAITADSSGAAAGAEVMFVPNPYRAGWLVAHGRVTQRRTHETPAGTYSVLHTDLPVVPGDSGSGLFNEFGELIGLNTWTRLDPHPSGISLPSEVMRSIVSAIETDTLDKLSEAP